MVTQQEAGSAIEAAVLDYFNGERSEMWIAMAAFVVVGAATAWLLLSTGTDFAMGLMVTVLLFGAVMSAGLAALMMRDHTAAPVLVQSLQTDQYAAALAGEQARVRVVLSKFRSYRLGAVVLCAFALAGLIMSGRGWVHGVASGLLLVVAAQVVIDHFSQQRADLYFQKLILTS